MRESVACLLSYKLKAGDWESYCRLVSFVFYLLKTDKDCLYSTGYNYGELVQNVIDAASNASAYNPSKYLIDPEYNRQVDAKWTDYALYYNYRVVYRDLASAKEWSDLMSPLATLAKMASVVGVASKSVLVDTLRVVKEYYTGSRSDEDAADKLREITKPIIVDSYNIIKKEHDRLLEIVAEINQMKSLEPLSLHKIETTIKSNIL